MVVYINMIKKDMELGIIKECFTCPVALAVNRTLQEVTTTVSLQHIKIMYFNDMLIAETPDHVYDFILNFDNKLNPEPISFTLDFKEVA